MSLARFVGFPGAIEEGLEPPANTLHHQPHRFAWDGNKAFNSVDFVDTGYAFNCYPNRSPLETVATKSLASKHRLNRLLLGYFGLQRSPYPRFYRNYSDFHDSTPQAQG